MYSFTKRVSKDPVAWSVGPAAPKCSERDSAELFIALE